MYFYYSDTFFFAVTREKGNKIKIWNEILMVTKRHKSCPNQSFSIKASACVSFKKGLWMYEEDYHSLKFMANHFSGLMRDLFFEYIRATLKHANVWRLCEWYNSCVFSIKKCIRCRNLTSEIWYVCSMECRYDRPLDTEFNEGDYRMSNPGI